LNLIFKNSASADVKRPVSSLTSLYPGFMLCREEKMGIFSLTCNPPSSYIQPVRNITKRWAGFALILLTFLGCQSESRVGSEPGTNEAAAAWPHPIPCRIRDASNPDLFVMTLGEVETPLAQGTFDPVKD
jgi:hypothetical protein